MIRSRHALCDCFIQADARHRPPSSCGALNGYTNLVRAASRRVNLGPRGNIGTASGVWRGSRGRTRAKGFGRHRGRKGGESVPRMKRMNPGRDAFTEGVWSTGPDRFEHYHQEIRRCHRVCPGTDMYPRIDVPVRRTGITSVGGWTVSVCSVAGGSPAQQLNPSSEEKRAKCGEWRFMPIDRSDRALAPHFASRPIAGACTPLPLPPPPSLMP